MLVGAVPIIRGAQLANRPNQQIERRLVQEWLIATYPRDHWQTNVRLGSQPLSMGTGELDDMQAKMVHSTFARFADAIVALPDRTLLVEAKVVAHPLAIAQLLVYRELYPFTPGLRVRADLPIEAVMVYARPDPVVVQIAAKHGIRAVQYDPPWIEDYLKTLFLRKQQAPQAQRMEISA